MSERIAVRVKSEEEMDAIFDQFRYRSPGRPTPDIIDKICVRVTPCSWNSHPCSWAKEETYQELGYTIISFDQYRTKYKVVHPEQQIKEIPKMKPHYVHKFDRIFFYNRWAMHKFGRPCDWTIIGISERWGGPSEYSYNFCFFGFQMSVWFKRTWVE